LTIFLVFGEPVDSFIAVSAWTHKQVAVFNDTPHLHFRALPRHLVVAVAYRRGRALGFAAIVD